MPTPSVNLLMAVHCHQPVGNFGFVFDEAFRKAYEPFIAALERHPQVRTTLHYSGPLLDWFEREQPTFIDRLSRLASQGQVEFLASGHFEPILPMIPEEDRQGQIAWMRRAIQRLFGVPATGLWLTERVWEPELPSTLAAAGIRYTMLDTNQFKTALPYLAPELQMREEPFWDLLGSYTTDHAGHSVRLLPMSKRLRYWIPFQDVGQSIDFLRRAQREGALAVTYADDGEKFGLWPKTYEWVYEQGWLERWFSALERESSWLKTATCGQYLQDHAPNGRVYLPCGSYEEMLEWSGGYFRNFLVKYPESQAMYRKMLRLSGQVRALKDASAAEPIRRELYMAQGNDPYWHGVFGGLYLANLRRETYTHLVTAEWLLQAASPAPAHERVDADGDGLEEIALRGSVVSVLIDPDERGMVSEVSYAPKAVNLADTLSRRYEPYHEKLKARQFATAGSHTPASIHDELRVKEEGLEAHLAYDDHRRTWFLEYALEAMPTIQQVRQSTWGEHRLWSSSAWRCAPDAVTQDTDRLTATLEQTIGPGAARKTISLFRAQPRLACRLNLSELDVPVIALELNLCFRDEQRLTARCEEGVRTLTVSDGSFGLAVALAIEPAATVMSFPIETVSDSEEGLERTVQGLAIVCLWPTQGNRQWTGCVDCTIKETA